jgi:outer membrane protein, heavy metal efflux system
MAWQRGHDPHRRTVGLGFHGCLTPTLRDLRYNSIMRHSRTRSITWRAFLISAVLLAGSRSWAQDRANSTAQSATSVDGRSVSLREVMVAVDQSPRRLSLVAQNNAASLDIAAAQAWPTTTVGGFTTWRSARIGVTVALPLPVLGIRRSHDANVAVAKADHLATISDNQLTTLELTRAVCRAWMELARQQARRNNALASAQRQTQLSEIAAQRFAAGDVARVDAVQADAARQLAAAQVAVEQSAIVAASAQLAALLGWDPSSLLSAQLNDDNSAMFAAPAELQQLRGQRSKHPAMQSQAARATAQTARTTLARTGRWPRLALESETAFLDPGLSGTDVRVGVTMELPLWGHIGDQVLAAQAREHSAALEMRAVDGALDGEIVAAHQRFVAATQHHQVLRDQIAPVAREAATLAREAYKEGSGGLISVLEAERALLDVEISIVDARIDAAEAHVDVLWSSGTLQASQIP